MADKNKVVEGLMCCIVRKRGDNRRCSACPYRDPTTDCTNMMHMDMMALLEASEDAECGPDYCEIEESDNGQHDED